MNIPYKFTEPPKSTVIIEIATSDGGSAVGSLVTVKNQSGNEYQKKASGPTVIFFDVPYGSFTVLISHEDYKPCVYNNLNVKASTVTQAISLQSNKIHIGDLVSFGAFNWRVLDIVDNSALLICDTIVECKQYHISFKDIKWTHCWLRIYLNETFYNSDYFSESDRLLIKHVTNENCDNDWYGTNGGPNTLDKIFLLGIDELVKYYGDSGELKNRPKGATWINDQFNAKRVASFNGSPSWWWIRLPGIGNSFAAFVSSSGGICKYGAGVDSGGGIRPALWIEI